MSRLRPAICLFTNTAVCDINDVMLCYGICAEELKQAYTSKFERNMTRR